MRCNYSEIQAFGYTVDVVAAEVLKSTTSIKDGLVD